METILPVVNCEAMDSYQTDYADLPPSLHSFVFSDLQVAISRKWKSDLDLNESVYLEGNSGKTENILLADLGLGNQAPEFSQSEFDLRNQLKERKKCGVRFLSQERNHGVDTNAKNTSDWTLSCSYNDVTCSSFSIEVTEECPETGDAEYRSHSSLSKGSLHNSLPLLIRRTVDELKPATSTEEFSVRIDAIKENRLIPSKSLHLTPRIKRKQFHFLRKGLQSDTYGPFVPKVHTDLPLGCRVKVIHVSGHVLSGWVRYIGPLPGLSDIQIGVELVNAGLGGDGSYDGKQIFTCKPGRSLFLPFRKVVMAWPI